MMRIFDFLLLLYPPEHRAEFGDEMRSVLMALAGSRRSRSRVTSCRLAWVECLGLIRGAAHEHCRKLGTAPASMAGGTLFASGMHLLLYWMLVPGKGKGLARILEHFASRVLILCMAAGIAAGQQTKQDPESLEIARSIYARSFTLLRQAKTMDDLRRLADNLDSPDWISVDRFGRTVMTREQADRGLEPLLALTPERRVTGMDILWAERDSERLIVVAWMMPSEAERADPDGEYGAKGMRHRLTRATLIRDIFTKTENGWRRVRHDKLLPNDTVLAVDGTPRIVPPLGAGHRVTPDQ